MVSHTGNPGGVGHPSFVPGVGKSMARCHGEAEKGAVSWKRFMSMPAIRPSGS
jgi:hypothetical protein